MYPALVQGKDAPKDLIRALNLVYRDNNADAIIIGRGGGSFEDLSCFNDESLARLLFASPIPTISAVGHEGDFTICDFVASFRAPTPTGAAMKLTKDKNDVINSLIEYSKRLRTDITSKLKSEYDSRKHLDSSYAISDFEKVIRPLVNQYDNLSLRLTQNSPEKIVERLETNANNCVLRLDNALKNSWSQSVHNYEKVTIKLVPDLVLGQVKEKEQEVDLKFNRLNQSIHTNINQFDADFQRMTDKLVILNPFNIMNKGYSIVYKDEVIISSIDALKTNDVIDIRFNDGLAQATINEISKKPF